jgi:hypothetical protein
VHTKKGTKWTKFQVSTTEFGKRKMFDEGVARGVDLGREEGHTVAKKGFDQIVEGLRTREAPKSSTADTSTQMDPLTTVSVQTNPTALIATMSQLPEHPDYKKGAQQAKFCRVSSVFPHQCHPSLPQAYQHLSSLALSTTASSSQSIPFTRSQKSALSCDFSQLELPVESLASNPIISAFKTRSGSTNFTENSQNVENH